MTIRKNEYFIINLGKIEQTIVALLYFEYNVKNNIEKNIRT